MKLFGLLAIAFSIFALEVSARELGEVELYQRCTSQITQARQPLSQDLRVKLARGEVDPITECLKILDRAAFVGENNTQIVDVNDDLAKKVLRTFHSFHFTWFRVKTMPSAGNTGLLHGTEDIYDISTPALYYTRALFHPKMQVADIVKGKQNYRFIRSNQNPVRSARSQMTKDKYIYVNDPPPFAAIGDLLGARNPGVMAYNYEYLNLSNAMVTGQVEVNKSVGGGLLTNPVYLRANFQEVQGFFSNGAERMPRKWAKSVFSDLLCRELPVIRRGDVSPEFYNGDVNDPSVPGFRTARSCAQCHASMDRMSAVIRNFKYNSIGLGNADYLRGAHFMEYVEPTEAAETENWRVKPEAKFWKRPGSGNFFYRTSSGQLINQYVNGPEELGQTLADLDDFYLCTAKRYYSYFTGIDVEVADHGDPDRVPLTAKDQEILGRVKKLATELKTHQRLRNLVESILRDPNYKKSDFGLDLGATHE
ncbi:MAG: hypothetical protein H6626_06105 [Pseudobdellovibrionaceae bacterium]|nr:hypothetical protein [Bdellovibrionales bacterium]USN48663.1 MAG: hypothetical protein H6626_06105 [Pseudobdellovibrionaceae bacterium]